MTKKRVAAANPTSSNSGQIPETPATADVGDEMSNIDAGGRDQSTEERIWQ